MVMHYGIDQYLDSQSGVLLTRMISINMKKLTKVGFEHQNIQVAL